MRKKKGRRKKKTPKHNKFLSYNNQDRNDRNFTYKNFEHSNSYKTSFTRSNFSFCNFKRATMKYCGFNGAYFEGAEFKHSNLRGCRFYGATFKNVVFYHTKLDKVGFKGATFDNVIFIGSSIKNARGIKSDMTGIEVLNTPINVKLHDELLQVIMETGNNNHIANSEVLVFKKGKKLNTFNITKLLERFSDKELREGLLKANEMIKNDFYTLSYLFKFLESNKA